MPPAKTPRDIEWSQRTLCSDESCIGVIGPDGNCKECGKAYAGNLPFETSEIDPEAIPEESVAAEMAGQKEVDTTDTEITDEDDEWANRILCRDENCIGVIGSDGRCKECGLPFEE